MPKFYVTTAIDYVNAVPHIGHAYEKIAADIVARYHRMRGKDVYFQTGVDEHGSKVEKSAHETGMSPKSFCDMMSRKFKDAWDSLNLSYDHFIRTTDPEHEKAIQHIFQKLVESGDIYKGKYVGLYCDGCEDFIRERDLAEDGTCPNHKKKPKELEEENYFFRLSYYKENLNKWLTAYPDAVKPEGRKKEILNQLNDPELGDFSVTRARSALTWGIPVPGHEEHVIYVWIDALSNYITGAGYPHDMDRFRKYWPAELHLIGKDINKFHSIYWPALLMALGLEPAKMVFAHGFITVQGQKISKSLGNVIDPIALAETYGADAVRYYLFAATPFDSDGDFSKEQFIARTNAELANNLGNLLNRTLTLIEKNCGGVIPDQNPDHTLRIQSNGLNPIIEKHMENLEFGKALSAIFAIVDEANKYMNDEAPWKLFKEGKQKEAEEVLFTCLEVLKRTAIYMYPFTPKLAADIWYQIGNDDDVAIFGDRPEDGILDLLKPGTKVRNQGPVFKRLEDEDAEKIEEKTPAKSAKSTKKG